MISTEFVGLTCDPKIMVWGFGKKLTAGTCAIVVGGEKIFKRLYHLNATMKYRLAMNRVDISIIVPIYNSADYLDACLDSIKKQKFDNYEVIMIDDGSTDNSADIAKSHLEDERFSYLHKKNGGASTARNMGIKQATGLYIAFVDSDDCLHPDFFRDFYDIAINHKSDLIVGKNSKFTNSIIFETYTPCFTQSTHLAVINTGFSSCGRLFHRSLFGDLSKLYPEGVWAEDNGYIPWLIGNANKIYSTENTYYGYRYNPSGTSLSERSLTDSPKAINYLFKIGCDEKLFKYTAIKSTFTIFRRLSLNSLFVKKSIENYIKSNTEMQSLIFNLKTCNLIDNDCNLFEGKDRKLASVAIKFINNRSHRSLFKLYLSSVGKNLKDLLPKNK